MQKKSVQVPKTGPSSSKPNKESTTPNAGSPERKKYEYAKPFGGPAMKEMKVYTPKKVTPAKKK